MCSRSRKINYDLKLLERNYNCNSCNLSINKDLKAPINIRNIGLIKVGKGIPEIMQVGDSDFRIISAKR